MKKINLQHKILYLPLFTFFYLKKCVSNQMLAKCSFDQMLAILIPLKC